MKNRLLLILLFSLPMFFCKPALAANARNNLSAPLPNVNDLALPGGNYLFKATIAIGNADGSKQIGETRTFTANGSILSIIDKFKDADLNNEFPGYVKDQSSVSGKIDFRGIQLTLSIKNVGNYRELTFCLGGECQVFKQPLSSFALKHFTVFSGKGAAPLISNKDLFDQLLDWLKGQGGSALLEKLAQDFVADTPADPIAGNPNSLMAELLNNGFQVAAGGIYNGDTTGLDLFSLHPSYAYYDSNGIKIQSANLPLKYTHYFNRDNALDIETPIDYTQFEGAKTYSLALGLGWMHVMMRKQHLVWSLAPSIYVGVAGSVDMLSGSLVYDAGLASRLTLPYGKLTYGITNDVSYMTTGKLSVSGIETFYDIDNTLTQNGFDVTYRLHRLLTVGGYYTRMDKLDGNAWYFPDYNEIGFKLAKLTDYRSAMYDHITLSAGYLFGPHNFSGAEAVFGFNF